MIPELIKKCRSYRRFDAAKAISREELYSIAANAKYTASAGNLQRLRFALFADSESCDKVFSALRFAAYLKEWQGPMDSERPVAYVVIASRCELDVNLAIDLGISAEAMLLAATEKGIGGCIFRAFNPEIVSELLPKCLRPHAVIALGYPAETVLISDVCDGDIKYYRDSEDRHVVPKRPLEEIII